jgi:murein DD-endopeptidase MepM/ murein hydrolase activator NlpD
MVVVMMMEEVKIAARTGAMAFTAFAALVAAALLVSGCAGTGASAQHAVHSQSRVTYTVARGDTLYRIASRFRVSVRHLMTANHIGDPRELQIGQILVIPGAHVSARVASTESTALPYDGPRALREFAWPVAEGVVSSGFGIRHGVMHDGVDIAAPAGTLVQAAGNGVVIFAGRLHGYGNTIIIRHDSHYATVYGHDEINLVRVGERVSRGETIGRIGATGDATGDNLHFEVRRDNVARNPLAYLPPPEPPTEITFAAAGGS